MSLKAFHIFFISISALLAFGFSGWLYQLYITTGNVADLLFAFLSIFAGIGLIVYGRKFLQKLKHVSFI